MIKAAFKLDDGRGFIVLGLIDENVRRLKQNDPILFDLSSLELAAMPICLTWKSNDGKAAAPKDFSGVLMAFSSKMLAHMRTTPLTINTDKYKFFIFVGKSQESVDKLLREFCGPATKIKEPRKWPGEVPPSKN